MFIGIIIYSFVFGILSAIVAGNKDRNEAKWFFMGLLFGIFGFITIIVLKTNNSATEFNLTDENKKCPDCAEIIKLEANVCHYCNYRFSEKEV